MARAAPRVAHVVQAIEHGDQVESGFGDGFRRHGLEADTVAQLMLVRVLARSFDRRLVEIEADKAALGIGLGHQQRRKADAAANIGHLRARLQPILDAVERRDPRLNDIVHIARTEERAGRAEQTAGMIAPPYARAIAEALLDLVLGLDRRGGEFERPGEIDRAVAIDEHHPLFGVEAEAAARRVIIDIAVRGLGQRPFADIAFVQPARAARQLGGFGRPLAKRVEQAEAQADTHRRHAQRAAEIAEHLADERMKFFLVDRLHVTVPWLWRSATLCVLFDWRCIIARPRTARECRKRQAQRVSSRKWT